jgi:ligand-binding sensor domain-containing protein/class 3 adenylate cyclase
MINDIVKTHSGEIKVEMRKMITSLCVFLFSIQIFYAQKIFKKVTIPAMDAQSGGGIMAVRQDHQGYIWILIKEKGLYRYDGSHFDVYNLSKDSASVLGKSLETMAIDSDDVIWIGTLGGGLYKFDPLINKFTHIQHQSNNPASLAHDTVASILVDHENNIWLGTYGGLDLYDRKTGEFVHHPCNKNDATTLSSNHISVLYEDRKGTLWIGCGTPFPQEDFFKDEGGLNRFDKTTGKFTRYLHDANNATSIGNNKVGAIFEDSKGNFWIGTAGDGLQTLNRSAGIFRHYYYDSTHPQNLSRGPSLKWPDSLSDRIPPDHITFIEEDQRGHLWIGTYLEGLVEYDPEIKKITHYGLLVQNKETSNGIETKIISADTATGFENNLTWDAYLAKDGLLWITTLSSFIYQADISNKVTLPFSNLNNGIGGNNFYDENDSTLWIATLGLIKKNTRTGKEKIYRPDEHDKNSLSNDITALAEDNSRFWVATNKGLFVFDPVKEVFTAIDSLPKYSIDCLLIDYDKNLWIATFDFGLYKMNLQTRKITHFTDHAENSNSLSNNRVLNIVEDKTNIWVATANGLNSINKKNGSITHYLLNANVKCSFLDAAGIIWAGTFDGLYYLDTSSNRFTAFHNVNVKIDNVLSILEDDENNLWVSAPSDIFEINSKRENVVVYSATNGVHSNIFLFCDNIKTKAGELLLGDQAGYYHFLPKNVVFTPFPPYINITSLQIAGKEVLPGTNSILQTSINKTGSIELAHNQNSFAIGFSAIHFRTSGEERYLYQLENYDNTWHDAGADKRAYFFRLPPANYIFKVRAVDPNGGWAEKDLSIYILPPWWQTWWFRISASIAILLMLYGIYRWRTATLRRQKGRLEQTVKIRTAELVQEKGEVEKRNVIIQNEKEKSDQLLLNILPSEVAEELKEKGYTTAKAFDEVTVLFSDIKGFTDVAEKMTAQELVKEINTYFSAFDGIIQKYGLEKIKTIGDAYIAAGGLPEKNSATAQNVVEAAIAMQQTAEKLKQERVSLNKPYFELRIGIHTGPVVAGVVGIKKFQYDIWGDTVNLAARMEQSGVPGKINISQHTYELVKDQFTCIHRGKIEAKNKGEIDMYFVE